MVSADDISIDDLDAVYPKRQISKERALALKSVAVRFTNQVHGDQVARLPEVEGSEEDFTTWVWAHILELRSGESGSESQSGGSVSYQRISGDLESTLSETRFGRMARSYMRTAQSTGIVKGRSHFSG